MQPTDFCKKKQNSCLRQNLFFNHTSNQFVWIEKKEYAMGVSLQMCLKRLMLKKSNRARQRFCKGDLLKQIVYVIVH